MSIRNIIIDKLTTRLLFKGLVVVGVFISTGALASEVAPQVRLPATFEIHAEAEVSGDRIMLLNIATCSGSEKVCEEAYGVDVGSVPAPGKLKFLNRHQILRILKSEWSGADISVNGSQTIRVKSKSISITKHKIRDALEETLKARLSENSRVRVSIKKIQMAADIVVRPGEYKIRFPAFESASDKGSFDYLAKNLGGHQTLEVVYGGPDSGYTKRFSVGATLDLSMLLPVAAHNIVRGANLTSKDFSMTWVKLGNGRRKYIENISDLNGYRAKRGISVGDSVTPNQIAMPQVIKRGQVVKLHMNKNGIEISGQIRALEAGGQGQVIEEEYIQTKKHIRVRVKDSKSVEYRF